MNKNIIIGGVVVIAIVIVAFIALSNSNKSGGDLQPQDRGGGEQVNTQNQSNENNANEILDIANKDTINPNAIDTTLNTTPNTTPGSYESYAPEKLAFAEKGDVVLFFSASWCPTCRVLDKNIKENLGAIPTDLKILKVDFDNSNELRRKYRVTTQHTLVQIGSDGALISKWSGSPTLSNLVSQIIR